MLVCKELLSEEQLEKLEETFDLPAVALVINDSRIGQGLKFLPRKMKDLVEGLLTVRNNVTAVQCHYFDGKASRNSDIP